MNDAWNQFAVALGGILGEAGLWLLAGFAAAGLLKAFVPQAWLANQLGRPGLLSVTKAAAFGAPMPLCSCSVIPAAAALRSAGASKGASASFAVATPEIDVPAFSLTWAMLGPVMAVARVIGAAVSAITAGLLIDALGPSKPADKTETGLPILERSTDTHPESCCSHDHSHEHNHNHGHAHADPSAERSGLLARLLSAVRYGFVELPMDLAPWLVVGLLISAAVGAFLPADLLTGEIGSGPLAIVAAMSLGLVIYVCATGSTPMVAALVAKGLGPGPALAFLLAGPATNPATMAWVLKDLGRGALVMYLGSIAGVAFLSGWGLQWLASGAWSPEGVGAGEEMAGSAIGGAVLAALLAYAMIRRVQGWLERRGTRESASSCCH